MTLDLNDPSDAREFIRGWTDSGSHIASEIAPDEEVLRLAYQLFVFCLPPDSVVRTLH